MDEPHDHGWAPLPVSEVVAVFSGAPFRWFIAGGHALEMAVGRVWRPHGDVDVGVPRSEVRAVHAHLEGWDLHVAAAGTLTPWSGRPLDEAMQENNVWARRSPEGPWEFDITVGGGDRDAWWSRRDPSIRVPWPAALEHRDGIPFLAPHLQLLMKSKDVREKDDVDARVVIRTLDVSRRRSLSQWLPDDHPWQELLAARNGRASSASE